MFRLVKISQIISNDLKLRSALITSVCLDYKIIGKIQNSAEIVFVLMYITDFVIFLFLYVNRTVHTNVLSKLKKNR